MDKKILFRSLLVLAIAGVGIVACNQGDTDGSGANTTPGGQYVSDGSAGGKIEFTFTNDLVVAGTAEFLVLVTDPNGAPIPFLNITCDTERGLAILEPTTGTEHTSQRGGMSGVIGGNSTGSFLLECRGPNGTQLIAKKVIKVTGEAPTGFVGFTGAAGGGLGGGVVGTPTPGPTPTSFPVDSQQVNFNDILFSSIAGSGNQVATIDLTQIGDCDGDVMTVDPEPFSEDGYGLNITNNRGVPIQIESATYSISGVVTSFTQFTQIIIAPNSTQSNLAGPFTFVNTAKRFSGTNIAVPNGTFNVTFTITGSNIDGTLPFSVTRSAVMTANNYNNCP